MNIKFQEMSSYLKFTLLGVLVAVLTFSKGAFAQKETQAFSAKNAVYLELGGSSGRYAVNYGRIIHQKQKLKLNVSVGFALWHYTYDIFPAN